MSTQFSTGPTRNIQPGDTPDLNDGLLSRPVTASTTILRGQACYIDPTDGFVKVVTDATELLGPGPFVPIESVTTIAGETLPISGVTAPQRVAMTIKLVSMGLTIFPGDYLKIETGGTGNLVKWNNDNTDTKYARFLGIEAALVLQNEDPPFDQKLSPGIVPDQSVTGLADVVFVGWVQLMESSTI